MVVFKFRLHNNVIERDHRRPALCPGFEGALPSDPTFGVWDTALREPIPFHHQHVSTPICHYSRD